VSQETSKTAVIATIAAELRGVRIDDQPSWFKTELGIAIGEKGRKGALRLRKQLSPLDAKKGRKSSDTPTEPVSDGWIWDTVGADLHGLDLERALVVFEPRKESRALVEHLRKTTGVTEVLEAYDDGPGSRVVARVIYWGAQSRARIDARLREAGVDFQWWDIRREVPNRPFEIVPAAKTWADLARQMAEVEGYAVET
jgi:hypothetical protein